MRAARHTRVGRSRSLGSFWGAARRAPLSSAAHVAWHIYPGRPAGAECARPACPGMLTPPAAGSRELAWAHGLSLRAAGARAQVREGPCACAWPDACDSQGGGMPPTRRALELAAAAAAAAAAPSSDEGSALDEPDAGAGVGAAAAACADQCAAAPAVAAALLPARARSGSASACPHSAAPVGALPGDHGDPEALAGDGVAGPGAAADRAADAGRGRGAAASAGAGAPAARTGRAVCADNRAAADAGARPESPGERGEAEAAALEAAHVHAVYEAIAAHFSDTRFAVWPKARSVRGVCAGRTACALSVARMRWVFGRNAALYGKKVRMLEWRRVTCGARVLQVREFLAGLPKGAVVADVGCGNGAPVSPPASRTQKASLVHLCSGGVDRLFAFVCDSLLAGRRQVLWRAPRHRHAGP